MSKKQLTPKLSPELEQAFDINRPPAGVLALLRQRALVWGETAADYDALFTAILHEIEPVTTFQWLHVKHLTDLAWEIHRYRRLKANVINLARIEAVASLLFPIYSIGNDVGHAHYNQGRARKVAESLERGNADERAGALQTLIKHGITLDDVTTQSMVMALPDVTKLETLIASAEARMVLFRRDIDRLKDAFADRFGETAQAIEDGTFTDVETSNPDTHP